MPLSESLQELGSKDQELWNFEHRIRLNKSTASSCKNSQRLFPLLMEKKNSWNFSCSPAFFLSTLFDSIHRC
jgi:hypothetical protein